MKTVRNRIPVSTAAKSGATENHPAAAIIPMQDKDLIMLIKLCPYVH